MQPKVTILASEKEFDNYAASLVVKAIQDNSSLKLTLPTGNTPVGMYALLVKAHQHGEISFKNVTVCNLDEYWPIDPQSCNSYAYFMENHLIKYIDIDRNRWHIPNGAALDPNQEAYNYDMLVSSLNIDVAVLGLGPGLTNHIGFNEAYSPFESRTRLVKLDPVTAEVNQKHFANPDEFVDTAITQGLGTIMEAKRIIMLAKGQAKAEGVKRFLEGPIDESSPASVLRTRANVEVVLDKLASSLLTRV